MPDLVYLLAIMQVPPCQLIVQVWKVKSTELQVHNELKLCC